MQEGVKKKYSLDCYIARFIPNISRFHDNPSREHCLVNRGQLDKIGGNLRRQIRIERPTANGTTLALYTVIDVHDQEPDTVFVGYKDPQDLRDRLKLSRTDAFTGRVNTKVTAVDLSYAEAESNSEFIEDLNDDGYNQEVVVIAPHGGHIEKYTDKQAERVGKQLSSKYVSEWICRGFKQGGGAFDRWHITSTDINEDSFPKLKTIIGRQFEYSVAFHGWDQDSICIGGLMPPDLKHQFKTAIMNAISGSGIVVAKDDDVDWTCSENFNGSHPKNIVNRLSAKSLHIEQSNKARTQFGIQIADAVAGVLGSLSRV